MKSWALSLALHGLAIASFAALWRVSPEHETAPSMRWRVSYATLAAARPDAEPTSTRVMPHAATPRQPPAMPVPARQDLPEPEPKPPDAPPRSPPEAAPRPPAAIPEPLANRAPGVSLASLAEPTAKADTKPAEPTLATPPPVVSVVPSGVPTSVLAQPAWRERLLARLRVLHRYPAQALRLGQAGEVLLEARFAADGSLEAALVRRGAGYPILDGDALGLLRAAARVLAAETRPERPTTLVVPIRYELDE